MGNKVLNVVVTDGDDAMREGIRRVFPNARHRLCAWHLEKNVIANIKDPEFYAAFKKSIYSNFEVDEFEEYWQEAIQKHGLCGNRWVQSTYEKKEMWATAYLRGTFCAGIRTTSRCEGINSFIKRFIKSKYNILQLVQSLERVVKEYRNNEVEAQFYSTYNTLVMTTGLHSIEESAARTYTRSIFRQVKVEMEKVAGLIYVSSERISTCVAYKMAKFGDSRRVYEVLYERNNGKDGASLECKCHFWEMNGIPCSHMFFVMKYEQIAEIPKNLIKKRWCKDVKSFEDDGLDDTRKSHILRYGALVVCSVWMSYLASKSKTGYRTTMTAIQSITKDLETEHGFIRKQPCTSDDVRLVSDPKVTKTKGAPKKCKDHSKKRSCSKCGLDGHTKRRCTKGEGQNIGCTIKVYNEPISKSLHESAEPSNVNEQSINSVDGLVQHASFGPNMRRGRHSFGRASNLPNCDMNDPGHLWYLQQFLSQQSTSKRMY